MLPYKSFISWNLGPVTIQSFGLFFALAFLAGVYLVQKSVKRKSDKDHISNLGIVAIVSGIIGARLFFVVQNYSSFDSFFEIFEFWSGGLMWYGGFLGGLLGSVGYTLKHKLDFWRFADYAAPALAIGQAIGRIGCILGDGGHVGKLTSVPWCFNVDGVCRHVTAWYSLFNLVFLYFILKKLEKKKLFKGFVFLSYVLYYSVTRFLIDVYRTDLRYFGLTGTQWICIGLFFVGSVLFIRKYMIR